MNARGFRLTLTLITWSVAVNAATLDGPRLGVVFDSAHKALRPILGIPGAAILGRPLELGPDLRKAAISPLQDYVLVTMGEHNQVFVLSLEHSPLTPVAVHGAARGPDRMVLSASGHAAALYYKDRNRIQVLSGLPAAPEISTELYLTAGWSPTALSVSDDAHTVLAGVGGAVYWVSPSGDVPILTHLHKITAIAFADAHSALVADAGDNRIHRIRNVTGVVAADEVAESKDGIANPVAVAVSRDGKRAFVANAKSGTVTILDLHEGKPATKVACQCTLTGLDRLAGEEVFRLTEPSDRPLWMLEASARLPRVLFVPPDLAQKSEK
jgi:hypothetical protein